MALRDRTVSAQLHDETWSPGAVHCTSPLGGHVGRCANVCDDKLPHMHREVEALLARSRRLGADKRVTNFGGGNSSAKLVLDDPITGEPTRVLAVKGSGGNLATLTASGLAFLALIRRAEQFLADRGGSEPFGPVLPVMHPLSSADRRREAIALAPAVRGIASADRPMVGHFSDAPVVLDFLSREAAPGLAALGTSCPDHFLRTKVTPLLLDMPPTAPRDRRISRLRELHMAYRAAYTAYYDANAVADSPPMRG